MSAANRFRAWFAIGLISFGWCAVNFGRHIAVSDWATATTALIFALVNVAWIAVLLAFEFARIEAQARWEAQHRLDDKGGES